MQSRQQERERYLARAIEADAAAARSINPVTRNDWLKIAEAYRILVRYIQYLN